MTTPILQCKMCYGKGYISYTDDDACDVVPCDCTIPVEVKR
jgi:hypothetical protein